MERSSSSEKVLKAFEDGGKQNLDCEKLLGSSYKAFSLLERWESAISPVESVMSIILKVREQGHVFFETLSDSIAVATALSELSRDAASVAGHLYDPSCTPEEIKDFIGEMRVFTQDALERSKRVSEALRRVRKGVNKICARIPDEVAQLEQRHETTLATKEAQKRRIERVRLVKTISTAALAIVGGISSITFPPLMLMLPVGLPIGILVMEMYEHRTSKTQRKREGEIMDCRIGLNQLNDINNCLAGLLQHVDALMEFWVRSDTMLETISNGVERIRAKSARLRLQSIGQQWEKAADMYLDYTAKLKCLVDIDCGATASLRSRTSSASESTRPRRLDKAHKRTPSTELNRRNAIKSSSRSSSKGSASTECSCS
ncbi:hypothetical protein FB45DRAFT_22857 [Roridomyces roridus]|uniref:Uncharacterized protein n=1 Tax=Roridomyces roridus TaxID=1738132 RepID=A0AAD7CJT0_9AGAR|nr:hypothetical protein FB45DRAFT_22857 [Roridomyces roridus]